VTNKIIFENYTFKFWKYVTAIIYIWHVKFQAFVCFNIECIMILINRVFFKKQNTKYVSFKIFLISIHDVKQANSSIKITIFHLNFKAWFNDKFIITRIKIEAHIVENLKINLLFEIDNLVSQEVIIDLIKQQAIISTCSNTIVKLNINVKSSHQLTHSIYINIKMIVSSCSEIHILIKTHETFKFSENQDYIFEFKSDSLIFYIHVMNASLSFAHAINITEKSVIISWKMQVEIMTECDFMNACHVDINIQALVLTESNIMQFSVFTKFSNSNFIKIKIISIEKITLYNKL